MEEVAVNTALGESVSKEYVDVKSQKITVHDCKFMNTIHLDYIKFTKNIFYLFNKLTLFSVHFLLFKSQVF